MGYAPVKKLEAEIPVIDVGPLQLGRADDYLRVAEEIRMAATTIGFFYVKNHGVPAEVIARAVAIGRRFFDAPLAKKNTVAASARNRGFVAIGGANVARSATHDLKETFSWGLELPADDPDVVAGNPLMGPNVWPAFLPELQSALYDYFEASFACGQRLLSAIAVSLGIDANFFAERYAKPFARGQIVHYPPQPPEMGADQFGIGQHTDFGCITLLWQDQNGGLQILNRDDEWIAAPPIEGALVINVGDLLERWSNDRFRSTMHRVVNASGRDRISMAVFYDPTYSVTVDPRDMGLAKDDTPLHAPVCAGDHIRARLDQTFAHRQGQGRSGP